MNNNLSQGTLAIILGRTQQDVSKWERSEMPISFVDALILADAFAVPQSTFFNDGNAYETDETKT